MTLWLIAGTMTALAVGLLLWPLLRLTGAPESRRGFDMAVYRDQLAEVERDLGRGVLTDDQATAARHEIERRLLGAAETAPPDERTVPAQKSRWTPAVAAILALALPIGALGLYGLFGSPRISSSSFHEGVSAEADMPGDMVQLVEQLARRMAESPEDPRGWSLLGRSYVQLGRYGEATDAFRQAIAHGGEGSENWADLGEVLTAANNGTVVPEADLAFAEALKRDPGNPRSRYYSGLSLTQKGRMEEALEVWQALAADSPPGATWEDLLSQQIAAARDSLGLPAAERRPQAAGPSAEDMAAAAEMGPEEQEAFIRSMVGRLAARLEQEPEDLDGWLRLTQAYRVLGERDAATAALQRAAALVADLPSDAPEHGQVERARAALAEGD